MSDPRPRRRRGVIAAAVAMRCTSATSSRAAPGSRSTSNNTAKQTPAVSGDLLGNGMTTPPRPAIYVR